MARRAGEVALALDGAVVLARRVAQLHADPVAGGEVRGTGEAHRGYAPVLQPHRLPGGEVAEVAHGVVARRVPRLLPLLLRAGRRTRGREVKTPSAMEEMVQRWSWRWRA